MSVLPRQHRLSEADWLELRYSVFQREYDSLVAKANFAAGACVLDAGCGPGTHAAALRRAIGARGQLVACDLSAENLERARERIGAEGYDDAVRGDILHLPFPPHSFDAVWCANVLQYLSDADADRAVSEMCRVLRPGGRIAVKDVDMLLWRIHPMDPLLLPRLLEHGVDDDGARTETLGALRGRLLHGCLARAGVVDVQQCTVLVERRAPLTPAESQMYLQWLRFMAGIASERGVSAQDCAAWRAAAGLQGTAVTEAPDFYACEGQVLASGRMF